MAHETHAKTLPAELGAPAFVDGWKTRALVVGVVFSVIAAGLAFADGSVDHVLRAWLLGLMLTFGFSVGGLALLMVQYCSGGKWGLLLRRPLEAMSRTLPLVFVYWLVIALSLKKLYLWAQSERWSTTALKRGLDQRELQAHCDRLQAADAEPDSVRGGEPDLLCDLGLLHMAAELAGPRSAMRIRRPTRRTGSRDLKTSAARALWSMRLP